MASLYDDPYELKKRSDLDITGGQALSPVPTATPPNQLAEQMATLIANMQSSPGGGTVTVNQPNTALSAVQSMQGGATPSQALNPMRPTRAPVLTTTAPVNTIDQNVQAGTLTTQDPMAQLANSIGQALNQPITLPTVQRKPADLAADYALEKQKATDQAIGAQAAEDAQFQHLRAGQRVAEEFPGQNPAMFPEGLSKTLEGGGTFQAMPGGGYASARTAGQQDAVVAARRANYEKNIAGTSSGQETARRSALLNQVNPLDYGKGVTAPPTATLEALAARGRAPVGTATRVATRPAARGGATDAMSNPAILRAIIANNKYDPAVRQRAQQRLSRL